MEAIIKDIVIVANNLYIAFSQNTGIHVPMCWSIGEVVKF